MKARACRNWLLPPLVSLALMMAAGCDGEETAHAETATSATPIATAVVAAVQIPEVDPCRDAPSCTYHGRCRYVEEGAREGECVAESDDDCRASAGCRDWGRCTAENEICIAADVKACQSSWHCRIQGRCTPKHGRCVVGGDGDCARSERCTYDRQCEARGNKCVR